jgi:hypothetical protein
MNKYSITTARDITGFAPTQFLWSAWFGDMDVDTAYGHGATEADAVEDLIDNNDCPWTAA